MSADSPSPYDPTTARPSPPPDSAASPPERIAPGHPEQNGRLERFHRTLKESVTNPPAPTLADQQRAFDAFRRVYTE